MKQKHASIPIFVPHFACPNHCVFCNQKRISGASQPPSDLYGFLKAAAENLSSRFSEVDIAFFGGSFTGIPKPEMIHYLSAAKRIREEFPQITGIRLSTRPDYINEEILHLLLSYGVTAVELGVQSLDDGVLSLSERGHTAADTFRAVECLKSFPFELILQLMPGLPGDTGETIRKTAEQTVLLHPDGVRIYPCVVLRDTPLAKAYLRGDFSPLTVEEAVEISADLCPLFRANRIKILRVGLHSSDLVQNHGVHAGPFHPAFGELTEQVLYFRQICRLLENRLLSGRKQAEILVAPGERSKATGQKRKNLILLQERYGVEFSVRESESVLPGDVILSFLL